MRATVVNRVRCWGFLVLMGYNRHKNMQAGQGLQRHIV
jgi:hypothetical protein